MLNKIWGFMILIGVVYGALTGRMEAVTEAALESAKEAVTLCITMVGVMSLWVGLMEIATQAGIIAKLNRLLDPVLSFLFPEIPKEHKAREYISTNIIANILGLGWACTPAGLKAMEELKELHIQNCKRKYPLQWEERATCASKEMCIFLVINISSLQLIPVNMIAYRSQYGSLKPAAIIAPAILATTVSTVVGVVFALIMARRDKRADIL
ncbi:MAG: nucleoside recognition protein [Lachnospiraceae bacterium]